MWERCVACGFLSCWGLCGFPRSIDKGPMVGEK
ncbi:hypothetical protein Zm00014a_005308 [Zea mays]|uniref:Uncharacterized protein n=1 Tax=Zea mays TaxID=4577 RepID=A0A3L6F491_MAIZE|nr:hypothetical protein Zm00014a_005308 [Zea mays]